MIQLKAAVLAVALVQGFAITPEIPVGSSRFATQTIETVEGAVSSPVDQTTPAPAPAVTPDPAAPPAGTPAAAPAGTVAATPQQAGPATGAALSANPEAAASLSGLQIGVDLDHYLGTGTFVDPRYYSYLAANLSISPRYSFRVKGVRLALTGSVRGSFEYTMPDNDNGRRFSPADSRIGLSAPAIYKNSLTGIAVTASIGAIIPTSLESWNATLITNLSTGLAFTRTFGRFDLAANVSGARGFHGSPVNAARARGTDAQGRQINIFRPGESATGWNATNTAWSFAVGGSVNWRPTDELFITVGYTFSKAWRYDIVDDNDGFSSKATDSNGNPVIRTGLGQTDRATGFVSVSYQLNDHFSLSLSSFTSQAPKTADLKGFRFPFWSFENASTNATSLAFTLSAAY